MPVILRDYQSDSIEAILNQWERGYTSTIVNLFTGAGKTVIFVEYCKRYIDFSKKRVLVMTPAHVILKTKYKFVELYPEFEASVKVNGYKMFPGIGVELANYTEPKARLVIGSVQTLIDRVPTDFEQISDKDIILGDDGSIKLSETSERRCLISNRIDEILQYGMIDEVIIDECHHAPSDSEFLLITRLWQICDALKIPRTKIIGFTATAYREDGRALANIFQTICISRSSSWAEKNGYLSPLKTPIRVQAQLPFGRTEVLKVSNWTDTIRQAWVEKGENRQTIGYFDSVESSKLMAASFREGGIKAAHIDGQITIDEEGKEHSTDERENIYSKFLTGQIRVICNYSVILEATDLPPASCMIWARPTDNIVLMTQALGRIRRLFEGDQHLPKKEDCLILDIVGDDLTVMTVGTLAGFKIAENGEYEKDAEIEVETLVEKNDGRDLRDTQKGLTNSNGVIYSIGKVIRKSGSDWYHDEKYDVLSLSISQNEALIVVPPFYTIANHLSRYLNKLEDRISEGDTSWNEGYKKVSKFLDLYNNYTLWHVKSGERPPKFWVYQDVNLDRLFDFTIPYMNDVSSPVDSFVQKNKRWKHAAMTPQQKNLLLDFCDRYNVKFDETITRGEASQLITHFIYFYGLLRYRLSEIYRDVKILTGDAK